MVNLLTFFCGFCGFHGSVPDTGFEPQSHQFTAADTQYPICAPIILPPGYNFLCESHMLSVSHDTSQLVSIQSDHVVSRVCNYGLSPMRPQNSSSCTTVQLPPLLFSTSTQKLCPWRAIDFSRVISVFPFTGRKWNNNGGEEENHGVTLRQTDFLSRKQNPK